MRTTEQRRKWRAELLARAAADPSMRDRAGHGRAYTYQDLGCRCRECTDVIASAARSRYHHKQGRVCDESTCVRCVLGVEN